jgi:hypothetical protein
MRAPAPAAAPAPGAEFEDRLRLLASQRTAETLQAGQISIIGLERVRERFGKSWERLADRAQRIARNTIERHLLPGDIFREWHDASYVIVFASLDPERAKMKCLLIADEVMKSLLGEEGGDLISVRSAVAQLEPGLGALLGLSPERFQAIGPDGAIGEHPADPDALPSVPASAAAAPTPTHRFAYCPMWDTTQGAISAYRCVAMPEDDDAGFTGEADRAYANDPDKLAVLDFEMQAHVGKDLARLCADGRRVLVILSVHFDTIGSTARRTRYAQTLSRLVPAAAMKLLVVEIADVPDGVPQSRLHELVSPLRPLCRGMTARVRLESADLSGFGGNLVHAVGCSIAAQRSAELAIIQQMGRFSRAAEKAGVACFVHGISSVSLTAAAVGAGFRYVDGSAIAKLVDRPDRVSTFNLRDFYRSTVPLAP